MELFGLAPNCDVSHVNLKVQEHQSTEIFPISPDKQKKAMKDN